MAEDGSSGASVKMDEGNPGPAATAAKPMVDDSPIMRGDEAAKVGWLVGS